MCFADKVLYKFETRLPIYSWFDDGNMITVYPFQGISYFGKTYYRAYVSIFKFNIFFYKLFSKPYILYIQ